METRVGRRQFLATGAASAVALTLPGGASAADGGELVLAGKLERLHSVTDAEVTLYLDGSTRRVRLAPGAAVVHGRVGAAADLRDFVAGEVVVVRPESGDLPPGDIVASEVQSMVASEPAIVYDAGARSMETSSGEFVVSPVLEREGAVPRGEARITYWTDPLTGDRHANAVSGG